MNGTQDFSKSIVSNQHNTVLYGLGIDKSSKRSDKDIINILQSVKSNNSCVVFVSHDINSNGKFSTTLKRLLNIISFVKSNNLKYYTASEISN